MLTTDVSLCYLSEPSGNGRQKGGAIQSTASIISVNFAQKLAELFHILIKAASKIQAKLYLFVKKDCIEYCWCLL